MRVRVLAATVVTTVTMAALSACGGSPADTGDPSTGTGDVSVGAGSPSTSPSTSASAPPEEQPRTGAPTRPASEPTGSAVVNHPAGNPLNCRSIESGQVGNAQVPLEGVPGRVVELRDGRWSTADTYLELEGTCGIGELNGDGVFDAVSAIVIDRGGTGKFYYLIAWTSDSGRPELVASQALGDRTPVEEIRINNSTHRITVVYLTRTDDAPLAAVNLRRTAVYRIDGNRLAEVSHTDEPYRP